MKYTMSRTLTALVLTVAVILTQRGEASTAFVLKGGRTVHLAKNLDGTAGDGYVFVNKRGVAKEAFGAAPGETPLRWVSKYGSVTFNRFGREFPAGGINEEGLVVEGIPGPADYPPADGRPVLSELQWVQYQLDNHRTVKEVLKSDGRLRIAAIDGSAQLGVPSGAHYIVADASGKTAVIEFTAGGRMMSFSGNELPARVLTDIGYEEAARFLRRHRGFGGELPVPAGKEAAGDRFVRAAAMIDQFAWAIQGLRPDDGFSILKAVERPDTQWSIVYNIPRRLILFKTKAHRRLKLVSLEALDFSCAAPVLMLPVGTEAGWVLTKNFEPFDARKNRALLEAAFPPLAARGGNGPARPPDLARRMAEYPETCRCR